MDDLYAALRTIAGVPGDGRSDFSVRCGAQKLHVSTQTDSDDDLTRVSLGCGYDLVARPRATYRDAPTISAIRPLAIALRPEHQGDVEAKSTGLSREWQSGDKAFDDAVYVDSPTSDPAVLRAVVGPTVRHATLALFALGFDAIDLDVDGNVRISIPASALRGPHADDRAQRTLDAFTELVSELPPVVATGAAHPAPPLRGLTLILKIVGLAGWLLNVGWVGIVAMGVEAILGRHLPEVSTLHVLACVAAGLVAGIVGASVYGSAVADRARGRSDAHGLVLGARLSAFGGVSVVVFTTALVLVLTR